jgi:prepilin-type N-terminal cleavage/methylation domain-containing protein
MKFFHFYKKKNINPTKSTERGFTLFELLVSVAIFTLLTTTLLVKHSQYKGQTVLTNLAYEIALIVRQAQVYGINVRQTTTSSVQEFVYAYGIHIDFNTVDSDGHTSSFILFSDSYPATPFTPDGHYTTTTSIENVETFTLSPGNWIQNVCLDISSSPAVTKCKKDGDFMIADILFNRPSPSAIYYTAPLTNYSTASAAHIYITSSNGICKQIDINKTGQISVPDAAPAAALCS